MADCKNEFSAGVQDLEGLLGCTSYRCPAECGAASDICTSGVVILGEPDCNRCLSDNCCDAFNTCSANGAEVQECIGCIKAGEGGERCQAAINCAGDSCLEQCGGG